MGALTASTYTGAGVGEFGSMVSASSSSSPTGESEKIEREVVVCGKKECKMVQYVTANGLCRKCHKPLDFPKEDTLLVLDGVSATPPDVRRQYDVASALGARRRRLRLSQEKLAERMQVPRTYISKLENDRAVPTLGSLARLAEALETDVAALIRSSEILFWHNVSDCEVEFLDAFRKLEPRYRGFLLRRLATNLSLESLDKLLAFCLRQSRAV